MGLTLLEEDLTESIRDIATRDNSFNDTERHRLEACLLRNLDDWSALTRDVHESARSSVAILDDLLNFDKIESGTLSLENTIMPIFGLIKGAYKEFRLSAQNKKIDFSLVCESPQPCDDTSELWFMRNFVGDSVRITQVIRNLCSSESLTAKSRDVLYDLFLTSILLHLNHRCHQIHTRRRQDHVESTLDSSSRTSIPEA